MTGLNSYRVLSVDLSFRDTGISVMEYKDDMVSILHTCSVTNDEFGLMGFQSLKRASIRAKKTVNMIDAFRRTYAPNVVIVEMPCFSQSAKSAMIIGMLWGAISKIECILVEPSMLKKWSNSSKGDGKTKVKEKVIERVLLSSRQAANDNIVDAVGLGLLFHDTIRKHIHENNAD